MPELPEVQTTVNGLTRAIVGHAIRDAWSDYDSPYFKGTDTIKDRAYFALFRKRVLAKKVVSIERRAKNILINLSGDMTIIVHMKMTGHLLYGTYDFDAKKKKDPWTPIEPESLKDPFNRHIHFMLSFDNGKRLALSDMRKFAKVTVVPTSSMHQSSHLAGIGPEPLEKGFDFPAFDARIGRRPHAKIKQVLMDQSIIAGIGNIYADESLWHAGLNPRELVKHIPIALKKKLYRAIIRTLSRGIDFGGDSMSDYRNVDGEKGSFQEKHHAYRKTGSRCDKLGCKGTIVRISLGGRGTHFCDTHQKLLKR